jgi:hypothetical protein
MPDIPFGDNTSLGQALNGPQSNPGYAAGFGTPADVTGFSQVTAPSLLQQISALGQGTAIGGGQGVGGMNFGSIGAGIQDFFQAAGAKDEANSYAEAATLASQEAEFTKENTAVQNAQADRQVMMTIGGQKTQVAAAGFTGGGSNLALLKSSAQQAALGHQMITLQGGINEAAYAEQAKAYTNMKDAEQTAFNGDVAGGVLNSIFGIFGL